MGSWGPGNLENDTAQDLIAEISDELFHRVIELLQDPVTAEYDQYGHEELFVRIEMISALHRHGMINSSPPAGEIGALFPPFLERWSKYHISGGHGIPQARQQVILKSFAGLLEIAQGAESGSFAHRLNLIAEKMTERREKR
jgi:hypothetical protein